MSSPLAAADVFAADALRVLLFEDFFIGINSIRVFCLAPRAFGEGLACLFLIDFPLAVLALVGEDSTLFRSLETAVYGSF